MITSQLKNVIPTVKIRGISSKIGHTLAYTGMPIGLLLVLTYSDLITQTFEENIHIKIKSINPSSKISNL